MGIPEVSYQVRRAPTLALRAVFTGIGRLLMTADRPQGRAPGAQASAGDQPRTPAVKRRERPAPEGAAQTASRWRSLDQTGNVRLLSAEDLDDDDELTLPNPGPGGRTGRAEPAGPSAARPATAVANGTAATSTPATSTPASNTAASGTAASGTAASGTGRTLPLADYDSLSLASIRARLRTLDARQLRVLADYERVHAKRPEVLGMYERRIEKLETGG
jgi:hypothetical protein